MVVDFSVWTESEAVAASFATAITPAALTIPSGGAAPAISSEHIVISPPAGSEQEEERGDSTTLGTHAAISR